MHTVKPARRIAPPDGKREALKANAYERLLGANTNLLPIFPYADAGAMVPCIAKFHGGPDVEFGQFFHYNSADEVVINIGANKAMTKTGQIFATHGSHGVNSFLRAPQDPEAFITVVVTQRQSEGEPQREAISFRCAKCQEELCRFDYDAHPLGSPGYDPTKLGGSFDDAYPGFPSLIAEQAAVELQEATRHCRHCGHENEAFPADAWGVLKYADAVEVVNRARKALEEAVTSTT